MGCQVSSEYVSPHHMRYDYAKHNLKEPVCSSQFQKDFYVALNHFRINPSQCTSLVSDLRNFMPEEFRYDQHIFEKVQAYLFNMKKLKSIQIDDNICENSRKSELV